MTEPSADDRLYPTRPILAVSVAVFRQGRVLVGRRARPPMAGRFSLPGGVVEVGETLIEAAKRELFEEVGVEAEIIGFNRHVEPILREGARVRAHFVIASFVGRWTSGEARVSDEIDAVAWIEPASSLDLPTTPELGEILEGARRIEGGDGETFYDRHGVCRSALARRGSGGRGARSKARTQGGAQGRAAGAARRARRAAAIRGAAPEDG